MSATNVDFSIHASADELAAAAARDWIALLESRPAGAPFTVALSGGRVTKLFFAETVRQSDGRGGLFDDVHFFWADERCVVPDHEESNFLMADELLLGPLGIPGKNIHRLEGEGNPAKASEAAAEELLRVTGAAEGEVPALDVCFLGMGEDGHTASLFPGEPESQLDHPALFRSVMAVKPPPRRITMGYNLLIAARRVAALVSGSGKERALERSLKDGSTPFGRVLHRRERSLVYADFPVEGAGAQS